MLKSPFIEHTSLWFTQKAKWLENSNKFFDVVQLPATYLCLCLAGAPFPIHLPHIRYYHLTVATMPKIALQISTAKF